MIIHTFLPLLHLEDILRAASLSELDTDAFEAKTRKVIKNAYLADQVVKEVLKSRDECENEKENPSASPNCEMTGSPNSSSTNGEDRAALSLLSLNGEASNRIMVNGQLAPVLQEVLSENSELVVNRDDQAGQNENRPLNDQQAENLLNCESTDDQLRNGSEQDG